MTGLAEYLRLFTAVLLDPPVRRAIREEADSLLEGTGRVGRVAEENLHVTLKFIGDVHRDDLAALDRVLAEAAPLLPAGEIDIASIGAFPDLRRPRVIWAGVSDPSGILTPVHTKLNETLFPFGAKREKKRYVPHVTVGRVRGPFNADRLVENRRETGEIWMGTQAVDAFALVLSELGRGGCEDRSRGGGGPPKYTVLGHYESGPAGDRSRQTGNRDT